MDLTAQDSRPITVQHGTGSRDGLRNADNQYMVCSDKVLDSHRVGLDFTAQRNVGEFESHPSMTQPNVRPRVDPSNIDFSKSMTQLLGSLGDLNQNLREGFSIVAACSDNWRHTIVVHKSLRPNIKCRLSRPSRLKPR